MSQFKIGDRVRVRAKDEGGWEDSASLVWSPTKANRVNTIGTISDVHRDGNLEVSFAGGHNYYFDPSWLELAEPKSTPPEVVTDTATGEKLNLRSELAFKLLPVVYEKFYQGDRDLWRISIAEDAFALADAFLEVARKTSVPGGAE